MNYAWNWGDGTAITTGATPSHTYAAGGFYNICLTIEDGLGCSDSNCDTSTLVRNSANAMITVNVVNWLPSYLGLFDKINDIELPMVYPNPGEGIFIFKDNKNAKTVEVFNLTGVLILSESNSKQINLSDFPKGIYFARINGEQVIKLVKE
jgi:PKD repeat protein